MINATFCFNPVRSDFIQPALDSLYKYTDMTNNKVVVVDGESSHGFCEKLKSFPITVLESPGVKRSVARRQAIEADAGHG